MSKGPQLDSPEAIEVCLRCTLPAHACDNKSSPCPFNRIGTGSTASKRAAHLVAITSKQSSPTTKGTKNVRSR